MEPLICDIPYPSVDNGKDIRSAKIISRAYAAPHGEIAMELQFRYHSVYIKKVSAEDSAKLNSIAAADALHAQIISTVIEKLGSDPIYVQYPNSQKWFDTSSVSRATVPQKIFADDIREKLNAIVEYNKMLFFLKNRQVSAIIQRLISDEQLHMKTLKEIAKKYDSRQL